MVDLRYSNPRARHATMSIKPQTWYCNHLGFAEGPSLGYSGYQVMVVFNPYLPNIAKRKRPTHIICLRQCRGGATPRHRTSAADATYLAEGPRFS